MQNASIAAPGQAGLGLGSLQKRRRGVRLTMGKNKTQDGDLSPAKIGDAIFGRDCLAGRRDRYCRRVKRRSQDPCLEEDVESRGSRRDKR
jgi:hypothetical protein